MTDMSKLRVTGRVSIHLRGFGFLALPEDRDAGVPDSAFVAPPDLNPFLDGDLVEATVEIASDGRASAQSLTLAQRSRSELFGSVLRRGKRIFLKVDRRVANTDWLLEKAPKDLAPGSFCVATTDGDRVARFDRAIDAADAGLTGVLIRHRIRTAFPRACLDEAAGARPDEGTRRDLRDLATVTIDAPHSMDLDDALSALPAQADGAVRVLVSIADVSASVRPGSALDQEARARGTSVYLPDLTVPMLPRVLSEQAISLLPGEDRATLTVELRIDPEGTVSATDIYESRIRSTARLSYTSVTAFLDKGDGGGVPEEVRATLRWLRVAAGRLSAARAARGGVSLERDEAYLVLDDLGEPTSIDARPATSAHQLVERLMVAANEAVACWLRERGLPALYRVQPEPAPDRVARLAELAANFGFETGFGGRMTPQGLSAFERQYETTEVAPAMRAVLRRVLGHARYTGTPSPHFGLAAPLYLHFTSPIRRYADLFCHRAIKAHLQGDRAQTAGDPVVEALAEDLVQKAWAAGKAENERRYMLVARLFAKRIGERFAANIIAVKPFGLVVQLKGLGVTGTVDKAALKGGPYRLDAATESLVASSRRYMTGQPLEVEVVGADEDEGRLELAPVSARGGAPGSKPKRPRRKP